MRAFEVLKVTKVGLVTPYIGPVNDSLVSYLQRRGLTVTRLLSFNLVRDSDVASVACESIKSAAVRVGRDPDVEVVFISCTSLRTAAVCAAAEAELGPGTAVVSSNMALAWHAARLLGCDKDLSHQYGTLFGELLPV